MPGLLGVLLNEFRDAIDQCVAQAVGDGFFAPFLVCGGSLLFYALKLLGKINKPISRIGPAIEQHVLHVLEQFRFNLLVHLQHPGIYDAHIEAGLHCVKQKRRVHRLAHSVVAAK